MGQWLQPRTLADASKFAAQDGTVLIAGGCELAGRRDQSASRFDTFVNLRNIAGLRPLDAHPKKGLRIGALTTVGEVSNHLWVAKRWAALHEATEQFSSPQARNTATIVGNVCAGHPCYDMATALLALRANLQIFNGTAVSTVELSAFYHGSGRPKLVPGDVVTSIGAPPPEPDAGSAFRKVRLMRRQPHDIPIFSAAAYIALDPKGTTIMDATVALGGCAPAPQLVVDAAIHLVGMPAIPETFEQAGQVAAASLAASIGTGALVDYKRRLARPLVRDVIEQAVSRARSKHDPFEDASDLLRDGGNDNAR